VRGRAVAQPLVLLAVGLLLYVLLWYSLDHPPTYSCSDPTDGELQELDERRGDFLLVAAPLLVGYGAWLGTAAWRLAAERNRRRGKIARPGRLALGLAAALVPLWALLIGAAFTDDRVGGTLLYGFLLGAPGVLLVGLCTVALLTLFASRAATRAPWSDRAESISVLMLWAGLLSALPYLGVAVAIAGKDATLWC
jgi:hypothetical protein